jgi:hypothetical protein
MPYFKPQITKCPNSAQDRRDQFPMNVRQPHVAAAPAVGLAGVVDAEEVEHRGVQVVDLAGAVDHLVAVVVGGAVDRAAADAGAGEPDGEAVGVRPNSPAQTTSVLSSKPLPLRSHSSPAMGWSTARALSS